jgi:chemotaxis signal transduction protein
VKNVLVVVLGEARFALELRWVREIFTLGAMTVVPTAPPIIAGVVNFKGSIVPVLHGRKLLGAAGRRAPTAGDALVLLDVEGTRAALAVDRIDAVTALEEGVVDHLAAGKGLGGQVPLVDPRALIAAARQLVEGTKETGGDAGDGGHGART